MKVSGFKGLSLVFILVFIFLTDCARVNQSDAIKKRYTITSGQKIYSASVHQNIVAFCAGEANNNLSDRIYFNRLGSEENHLFRKAEGDNKQIMPVRLYNERFVWVEYALSDKGALNWGIYTQSLSEDTCTCIKNNNLYPDIGFPHFDISDEKIIFDFFSINNIHAGKFPLYIYDPKQKTLDEIFYPGDYSLYDPSFNDASQNQIVCNLVSFADKEKPVIRIAIYNIQEDKWNIPDSTISGFQPSLYKTKLVYKESKSPYAYGIIHLYDLTTKQNKSISEHPLGGEFPQINEQYVVWESPGFDEIPAYDLLTGQHFRFDSGVTGKPFLNDNSLIWVKENNSKEVVLQSLLFHE